MIMKKKFFLRLLPAFYRLSFPDLRDPRLHVDVRLARSRTVSGTESARTRVLTGVSVLSVMVETQLGEEEPCADPAFKVLIHGDEF
jgi:hypothetical protein